MGSGLIYAVIIVMWAAYFIPRWLRRHEELSESRSVERFDHAMRILSRRDPVGDQRYVVVPPRPEPAPGDRGSLPAQRDRRRRPPVSPVAMRRRRVLAALMMLTLVTGAVVPLTPAPWWSPLVGLGAVVLFLVHCRLQARTSRAVSRTRDAVRKRSRSRLMRFDALDRLMTVRRELAEDRAAEERRWAETEEAYAREREAEERRAAAEAQGWQPVPVPLPTYVSKPMAPRRAPTIDLTRPGAWSEAQGATAGGEAAPFDQTTGPDPTPGRQPPMSALLDDAEDADDQLDSIIRPRAVND